MKENNNLKGYVIWDENNEYLIFPNKIQDLFNTFADEKELTQLSLSSTNEKILSSNFSTEKMLDIWIEFIKYTNQYTILDNRLATIDVPCDNELRVAYRAYTMADYYLHGLNCLSRVQQEQLKIVKELFIKYRNYKFDQTKKNLFKRNPDPVKYIKALQALFPTWDFRKLKNNIKVFTYLLEDLLWVLDYPNVEYHSGWFFLQSLRRGGNGKSLLQNAFYSILVKANAPVERISLSDPKWGTYAFRDNLMVLVNDIIFTHSNKTDYDKLIKNTADLLDGDTYTVNIKGGEIDNNAIPHSINLASTNSEIGLENVSKYKVIYYYDDTDFRLEENKKLKKMYCVEEKLYPEVLKKAIEFAPFDYDWDRHFKDIVYIPQYVNDFREYLCDMCSKDNNSYNANNSYSMQGLKRLYMKVFPNANKVDMDKIAASIWQPAIRWLSQTRAENGEFYIKLNRGGGYNADYAQYFFGNPYDLPSIKVKKNREKEDDGVERITNTLCEECLIKTKLEYERIIKDIQGDNENDREEQEENIDIPF